MSPIRLLGAERQAASSFALAYPERAFEFLSDQEIVDGWDLPNVRLTFAKPEDSPEGLPLCPRWLSPETRRAASLGQIMPRLAEKFPDYVLPIVPQAETEGKWVLKGDLFHRPDAPLSGAAGSLADVVDTHGCGLVYQPEVEAEASFLVMGRRRDKTNVTLGVLKLLAERFFRIDVIQAARTVERADLVALSLDALDALAYTGWFSLNWIEMQDRTRLASFRPVPHAGLLTLRQAGADLLEEPKGVTVASPNHGFMAYPHYASYKRIGA
jgi:hypothetical protein